MKRNVSIILFSFILLLFVKAAFSVSCGNYGGDSCSNMDHQEVGDAVYRDITLYEETYLLDQYQHAAIFYGYNGSILQVLQATGNWVFGHSVHYGNFEGGSDGFLNNSNGETYYGAYSRSSLSDSDRNNIKSGDVVLF